jgi:hypothetical protein
MDAEPSPAYRSSVTEDNGVPVWRDPLNPLNRPTPPTGSGTGAYIEQPEPRPNTMTIEGEIAGIGRMAQGLARNPGAGGMVGRIFVGLALLGFGAGAIAELVSLFRG